MRVQQIKRSIQAPTRKALPPEYKPEAQASELRGYKCLIASPKKNRPTRSSEHVGRLYLSFTSSFVKPNYLSLSESVSSFESESSFSSEVSSAASESFSFSGSVIMIVSGFKTER